MTTETRPVFWDWIIFSEELEGKVWGSIDGIQDDAPEEMKRQFWEWIEKKKTESR